MSKALIKALQAGGARQVGRTTLGLRAARLLPAAGKSMSLRTPLLDRLRALALRGKQAPQPGTISPSVPTLRQQPVHDVAPSPSGTFHLGIPPAPPAAPAVSRNPLAEAAKRVQPGGTVRPRQPSWLSDEDMATAAREGWAMNIPQVGAKMGAALPLGAASPTAYKQAAHAGPPAMFTPDRSDAFRLGCYATAKHAGASHDEAMSFVRGLEVREAQQFAFRLGAYKVAREQGASEQEAVAFTQKIAKAVLKGLWDTAKQGVRAVGNKVTDATEATAKNIHRAKGGLVDAAEHGPMPAGMTHFEPGSMLQGMRKSPGVVGAGALAVGGLGTYGAGRMAFGGGGEAAPQQGEQMDPNEMRALMHQLLMAQQNPGFVTRHGYNPYVYGY